MKYVLQIYGFYAKRDSFKRDRWEFSEDQNPYFTSPFKWTVTCYMAKGKSISRKIL